MKEFINGVIGTADSLFGPIFDELGTTRISTGLTTWDIVDRGSRTTIGKGREIAGDGLIFMNDYYEQSTLRKQLFGKK